RGRIDTGRELEVDVVVVVEGQRQLLEVVGALHPCGSLADLLHRGEQQANQDGNDGDHHQQLDQREAAHAAPQRPWRESHESEYLRESGMTGQGFRLTAAYPGEHIPSGVRGPSWRFRQSVLASRAIAPAAMRGAVGSCSGRSTGDVLLSAASLPSSTRAP